jgi:hypothetical protein
MSKAVDERAERGDLIDNCLISRGLTVLEQAHGPDAGLTWGLTPSLIIRFGLSAGTPVQ